MNWRGWINSNRVRVFLAAAISLVLIFSLLSHLLANKSKADFHTIYGNMSAVNGSLICDSAQSGASYVYDAFYKTQPNPETYLAGTAQKQGYAVASDIGLVKRLSAGADRTPSYNKANLYLNGTKKSSKLAVYIFQAGSVKVGCSHKNETIPVSHNHPVVEIRFSR